MEGHNLTFELDRLDSTEGLNIHSTHTSLILTHLFSGACFFNAVKTKSIFYSCGRNGKLSIFSIGIYSFLPVKFQMTFKRRNIFLLWNENKRRNIFQL